MADDQDVFYRFNPRGLEPRRLFEHALVELSALGTKPRTNPQRWWFDEERRGALDRLASLAGHDGHLLRRAALHVATGPRHRNRKAAQLLMDATRFGWRGRDQHA
jgi:hypothetical protein